MTENAQIFRYNGSPITFNSGDSVMVNATEMAKPFGKAPKDWLRTSPSKEFISALSAVRHICPTDLVQIKQGGNDRDAQGTWLHEDIALEFARWLSPAFAIWCNDRIKELLLNGNCVIRQDTPSYLIDDPIQRAEKWIEEQKQKQALITSQQAQIATLTPKANFYDEVLRAENTFTTTQVASIFGRSAIWLNKWLCAFGIQYKHRGAYYLTASYKDKGLVKMQTVAYYDNGEPKTRLQQEWTMTGRKFLIEFLKQKNLV